MRLFLHWLSIAQPLLLFFALLGRKLDRLDPWKRLSTVERFFHSSIPILYKRVGRRLPHLFISLVRKSFLVHSHRGPSKLRLLSMVSTTKLQNIAILMPDTRLVFSRYLKQKNRADILLGTFFISVQTNDNEGSEFYITIEKAYVPELVATSTDASITMNDYSYLLIEPNVTTLGTLFPLYLFIFRRLRRNIRKYILRITIQRLSLYNSDLNGTRSDDRF